MLTEKNCDFHYYYYQVLTEDDTSHSIASNMLHALGGMSLLA